MKKAVAEVDAVLGSEHIPDSALIPQLIYLNNCFKASHSIYFNDMFFGASV